MSSPAAPAPSTLVPARASLDQKYTWDLSSIFTSWDAWEQAFTELDRGIEAYKKYEGTLAQGGDQLLRALTDRDALGAAELQGLVLPVAAIRRGSAQQHHQRAPAARAAADREVAAGDVVVSARVAEAAARDRAAVDRTATPGLAVYRFAIEEVFRLQEHVLNEQGERLLSLTERLGSVPKDSYAALSTADARFPTITLSTGETTQVSYGQYRKLLATCRSQADRRTGLRGALRHLHREPQHLRRDLQRRDARRLVRGARARLQDDARCGALRQRDSDQRRREPDSRDQERRRAVPPLSPAAQARARSSSDYYVFDAFVPLVDYDVKYPYDEVLDWIVEAVSPLGAEYQARVRRAFSERWIDVYENQGKRSGAYSAPVYGANPYMLMNYNDTLDAVFTLAHELGHSMHTMLSHETQPFVYAGYTIFVAEVPSTLNEALLLDFMLARAKTEGRAHRPPAARHRRHRRHVLQPGAVCRLRARGASAGREGSADHLGNVERHLFEAAWRVLGRCAVARSARAAHLGAHSAFLPVAVLRLSVRDVLRVDGEADGGDRRQPIRQRGEAAVDRYLKLLKSGGSDHPMTLLQTAGVDLSKPETVRAVSAQLDGLVDRFERELA